MTEYIEALHRVLECIRRTQMEAIQEAGRRVSDAVAGGGILHVFGTGHSHMMAEEAFFRAGGLAPVNPILSPRLVFLEGALASTWAERESGYARQLLEKEDIRQGDAAIVVSNSGRNAAPIEMAMEMRERGVTVIAITNVLQSRHSGSRHASGKRLFELADVVIDNCVPEGDAVLRLPGLPNPIGASSTVAGATIINLIVIETAQRLRDAGVAVPVLPSANAGDNSDGVLQDMLGRYEGRIRYFAG